VAHRHNVAELAASLDEDPAREREVVAAFTRRRVDGLIVVPAGDDQSYLLEEARAGTSIVFVDRPPRFFDADVVLTDNHAGARVGVRHLVDRGHRRIAILGDLARIYTARERLAGAHLALEEAGLGASTSLVSRDLRDAEVAREATLALLAEPDPPTAIFAAQNLITIGALRALHEVGRHHDVALVGFDDFSLADLVEPAVTVVAQDPKRIGELAAEELFRRIDGDGSPRREHVVPTRLIERGSGEIPPPS
jgi:LacI family transcriptional regulator